MKRFLCFLLLSVSVSLLQAQSATIPFNSSWQFHRLGNENWYRAEVPGTVHTDLLENKIIPDPFYRDNELKVQWVEKEVWEYKTQFTPPALAMKQEKVKLVFDGLDTYAKVFLNNELILDADNMFRQWKVEVRKKLKQGPNELRIIFSSAVRHDDSLAGLAPVRLAGENNRMYSRKAQYQYGWDWGPRLVTCGIWQPIHWELREENVSRSQGGWNVKLVDKPDAQGRSFYFTKDGKPVFIKGANWIPCESFIPRAKKLGLYTQLIKDAKDANINMLRVWGGGIYEDEIFYDLCDKYGIMVWQDLMFAGAMYPYDEKFMKNIEGEIRYQVARLKKHPCVVIWCGNNEIDEAWHNWGWQRQYQYSAADSAQLWNGYQQVFHKLIPGILKELDPSKPYWPSSPSIGWGRDQAYKQGDVHYWGVWWGKEPVEKYREKIGRFHTEYGMQAFPSMQTIRQFTLPGDLDTNSTVMRTHEKHPAGYGNIKFYIEKKFKMAYGFENLVYISQLMQADAIKTAIDAHRGNMPYTMGTMIWQWNDCWPVVSWSAVDYYGRKKALFYQVKRSYSDNYVTVKNIGDSINISGSSVVIPGKKVMMEPVEYDKFGNTIGRSNAQRMEMAAGSQFGTTFKQNAQTAFVIVTLRGEGVQADNFYPLIPFKEMYLPKPHISWQLFGNSIYLTTDMVAYGVEIGLPEGVEAEDNYFSMKPADPKLIKLTGKFDPAVLKKQITIRSLADLYN